MGIVPNQTLTSIASGRGRAGGAIVGTTILSGRAAGASGTAGPEVTEGVAGVMGEGTIPMKSKPPESPAASVGVVRDGARDLEVAARALERDDLGGDIMSSWECLQLRIAF
jgi:hypothetical protein